MGADNHVSGIQGNIKLYCMIDVWWDSLNQSFIIIGSVHEMHKIQLTSCTQGRLRKKAWDCCRHLPVELLTEPWPDVCRASLHFLSEYIPFIVAILLQARQSGKLTTNKTDGFVTNSLSRQYITRHLKSRLHNFLLKQKAFGGLDFGRFWATDSFKLIRATSELLKVVELCTVQFRNVSACDSFFSSS